MTRSSIISLGASIAGAVALLALLLFASHVDLPTIRDQLLKMHPVMLLALTALLGFNSFLSGEKWRLVDCRLRGGEAALPRQLYFGLTALGTMLGLLIPVQLSAALTRSLGLHLNGGRAVARGTAASLLEQGYDVLVAGFLALASIVMIARGGGDAVEWIVLAGIAGILGWFACGMTVKPLSRSVRGFAMIHHGKAARVGRLAAHVADSGLLDQDLARPLFALSLLRFFILSLMACATTAAVGLDVPLWQLSAALPLVVLAAALPITPGGLGVIEWAFTSALVTFGTRLDIAAQWAVLNRVAVTIAAIVVGVAGALVGIAVRSPRARSPAA